MNKTMFTKFKKKKTLKEIEMGAGLDAFIDSPK